MEDGDRCSPAMTPLGFPLPFTAALLAGMLVAVVWRQPAELDPEQGASARAQNLFALFFASVRALAVLAGLRVGYHSTVAATLQPILAMTPAPLSWLAFQALTAKQPERPWRLLVRHGWPVVVVAALVLLRSPLIDPAIVASFLTYAFRLARLRAQAPDILVETSLGDVAMVTRLLSAVIVLHLLSAAVDTAVALDLALHAGRKVGPILAVANLALVAALALGLLVQSGRYTVRPQGTVKAATIDKAPSAVQADDAALITKLDDLLVGRRLYQDPDLTIARLARRMGVPSRRISQAINRSAGVNISQFINNHRIAQAQLLLRLSDSSVTEVMLAAGFQTKSNFNREFRRVTAQSPSGWRRSQGDTLTTSAQP